MRVVEPTEVAALEMSTASVADVLSMLAPQIRGWVFRHVGPGPDLDDAVQEALIEIADALSRFEGRAKLTTYARRIAVRAATRYRRRHPRPRTAELHVMRDDRTPERLAMERESIRHLYKALDELSPKLRTAFILCDIEREPHESAALIEEISLDALQARLKRARAQLREILANDPYLAPMFGGTR